MKRQGFKIAIIPIVLGLWVAAGTVGAAADATPSQLVVSVSPERVSTSVGSAVAVTVTVANRTAEPTPDLAIHLDITDPRASGSVDPEDWTSTLTHFRATLQPDKQVAESWTLTPIKGGDFTLYAVVIDAKAGVEPGLLVVSNGVPVHVDEKRSFNPQGVLPLAIAMPAMIGMALLWRYRRLRE